LSARCVHFLIAFAGNWAFELRGGSTGSFWRRSASLDSFMENVVGLKLTPVPRRTLHRFRRSARWPTSNQSSTKLIANPPQDGYLDYLRLKLRRRTVAKAAGTVQKNTFPSDR
jgi:hypothetical protein